MGEERGRPQARMCFVWKSFWVSTAVLEFPFAKGE